MQCASAVEAEVDGKPCGIPLPIGSATGEPSKNSPRTNDRVKESTGSKAVAELHAVGDYPLHAQVTRQRAHHLFESLTDQHYVGARVYQFLEFFHASRFQVGFQFVL